jgi:hypothetical protein
MLSLALQCLHPHCVESSPWSSLTACLPAARLHGKLPQDTGSFTVVFGHVQPLQSCLCFCVRSVCTQLS